MLSMMSLPSDFPPAPPPKPLLTAEEAANMFNVSVRTWWRWLKAKQVPSPIRPGGPDSKPFWRRSDLELFIKAGSIAAYRREKSG